MVLWMKIQNDDCDDFAKNTYKITAEQCACLTGISGHIS